MRQAPTARFSRVDIDGSNRRPLPCKGKKAGRHYWALGRNPLGYKGFCAHPVALVRAVFHPLAYFLPTLEIRTTGSSSQPTTSTRNLKRVRPDSAKEPSVPARALGKFPTFGP